MDIKDEIAGWDGKAVDAICDIYHRYCNAPSFIAEIIPLIREVPFQKGATWLLKHYFEAGGRLGSDEIHRIYGQIPNLEHWETKLHILQCLRFMPITAKEKKRVENFLRKCLVDENKFVRAWAYDGFHELSIQHQEYREEVRGVFETAMRDEAPSVKARIRNIIKKGF